MTRLVQIKLINWFEKNKRDLPWRLQPHWYHTFLSEYLLQQTQVEQALPYYQKFLERYPDIKALAKANEDDVLSLWTGLGYYARARNMLKAAISISEDYQGKFPENWEQVLNLPGIGPYTASAILSIAFNQPFAVLDGNVIRVLSRIYAIGEDSRLPQTRKKLQALADRLLPPEQPGLFNEAMMELGALICLPKNPDCLNCPICTFCKAQISGKQEFFPFKSAAAAKKELKHYVFLIENNGFYFVQQRQDSGLLARMWEFPVREVASLNHSNQQNLNWLMKHYQIKAKINRLLPRMQHVYSHIRLQYDPIQLSLQQNEHKLPGKWLTPADLREIALHGAHRKILDRLGFSN